VYNRHYGTPPYVNRKCKWNSYCWFFSDLFNRKFDIKSKRW
jgi:hypothetical protein